MKKLFALVLAVSVLTLGACGALDLDDVETSIRDEEGFSFELPAAWQETEPASAYGVCAFCDETGRLTLEVVRELGAMEYYSLDELGDMVAATIGGSVFSELPAKDQWTASGRDNRYSCAMQGQDAAGQELVCRVDLVMPYPSIHYYLVYLAAPEAYAANRGIADGILAGFTATKSAEEMYQLINEERTAAAEAEAAEAAGAGESGEKDEQGVEY